MSKSFSDLEDESYFDEATGTNLIIIDSLNLAFRWIHQKNGNKLFAEEYVATVISLAKSYSAKQIVLLSDFGSSNRKNIYPEYKSARKEKRAQQTPEEEEAFKKALNEVDKAISILIEKKSAIHFKFPGVEADDIAACLTDNYASNYGHTWLISSDKDWNLLINENVSRFSYVTKKEYIFETLEEDLGCSAEEYISLKVLMGDSGDSIPGITGIGPKRAIELINTYGNAFAVLDALPIEKSNVYIKKLNEQGPDVIPRNYALVDLLGFYEDNIGKDNIQHIKNVMREKICLM
jgi:5'-3' exonuclease